jgi:hypothetical protein
VREGALRRWGCPGRKFLNGSKKLEAASAVATDVQAVTAAYRSEAFYRENWLAKNAVNKKKEHANWWAGKQAQMQCCSESLSCWIFFDGSQLDEFKSVRRSKSVTTLSRALLFVFF